MRDYAVVRHGGGRDTRWTVEIDHEVRGHYPSEWAALLDAVDAAKEDIANGVAARVVIRAGHKAKAILWQVGDPYPNGQVTFTSR